jgi:hypothetical protein
MEILDTQTDKASLLQLAADGIGLLASGDFDAVASRFGYALAYGRDRSMAIRADLAVYLSEIGSANLMPVSAPPNTSVAYFKPNETGLFAALDCVVPTNNGAKILVSFVVSTKGARKYFSLEGLSTVA